MSTAEKDNDVSVCANCGKVDDVNNICNKCEQVKYCNAACKKKHRHKHKKDCEEHLRLVAERAAELHDEKLFKQPPPNKDCPICFLCMPTLVTGYKFKTCCGKMICSGCDYAPVFDNQGNEVVEKICPFCRTPRPNSDQEMIKREKKRMEAGDPIAIGKQGEYYSEGMKGYPQDIDKALELFYRAGELGYAKAYTNIGYTYQLGRGVEIDKEKAKHYWELAAVAGDVTARYNLGINEKKTGNMDRALKHHTIAIRDGHEKSLKQIQHFYSNGHASKDHYTKALQLYQAYLGEIKSKQRDEAAAAHVEYRYY